MSCLITLLTPVSHCVSCQGGVCCRYIVTPANLTTVSSKVISAAVRQTLAFSQLLLQVSGMARSHDGINPETGTRYWIRPTTQTKHISKSINWVILTSERADVSVDNTGHLKSLTQIQAFTPAQTREKKSCSAWKVRALSSVSVVWDCGSVLFCHVLFWLLWHVNEVELSLEQLWQSARQKANNEQ